MNNKIYDSEETLMAGLKAEQDTIIEYTRYLNLAKQNNNESEVKLWEHIIADEREHAKEFENALKGDFKLLDEVIIKQKTEEEISKEREIRENFIDDIVDVLADDNFSPKDYKISAEDPYYYIDFADNDHAAWAAYDALRDAFFKVDVVDDDGFFYVRVVRR